MFLLIERFVLQFLTNYSTEKSRRGGDFLKWPEYRPLAYIAVFTI